MEFSLGNQFSREFSFEDSFVIKKIKDFLNNNFEDKIYGDKVIKIYCSFICVSKDFELFFMVRPLKIYKSEAAIEFEVKLDFGTFFKADEEERFKILCKEFLNKLKDVLKDKRLKESESDIFLKDIENLFVDDLGDVGNMSR